LIVVASSVVVVVVSGVVVVVMSGVVSVVVAHGVHLQSYNRVSDI